MRHFATIDGLRQALPVFKETYNREWLIARLVYRSPAPVRQVLVLTPAV